MSKTTIKDLDLNLLKVFSAICQHGTVSKASKDLALTQSAVSHALNRLREQLNDPLFVRVGNKLEPTQKALVMGQHIESVLADITNICFPAEQFSPKEYMGDITVAVSGPLMDSIGKPISKMLFEEFPFAKLHFTQWGSSSVEAFNSGSIDIGINHFPIEVPKTIRQLKVCDDISGVAFRKNHPFSDADLSPSFLETVPLARMVFSEFSEFRAVIEEEYKDKKFDFQFTSTNLSLLTELVKESDLMLITFLLCVSSDLDNMSFKAFSWDTPPPKMSVAIYVHQRNHSNPVHQWVIQKIKASILDCYSKAKNKMKE